MNNPGRGGRGKRAPYETMMCRVPQPLKPTVEAMANRYRELVTNFQDPYDPDLVAAVISAIAPEAPGAPPGQPDLEKLTDTEKFSQLQNQVTELQKQVKNLEAKLNCGHKQKKELEDEVTEQ